MRYIMLEICLDANWYAALRSAQAERCPLGNIVAFEDCLTFGDISDLSACARMAQLGRWGISVNEGFHNHQQQFYEQVPQESSIRIWTGNLPHQILAMSLACALARTDATVMRIRNTAEQWLLDNRRPLDRLDEFIRDAQPVDRAAQAAIWKRLVRENSDLRIVSGGIPQSVEIDVFDSVISRELAQGGWDGSAQRAYEIAGACANQAGGMLAPEFFSWRIRHLLDRARDEGATGSKGGKGTPVAPSHGQ